MLGAGTVFEVDTLRKVYLLRASSAEEVSLWLAHLNARKQQSIKESMGHAPLDAEARAANDLGSKMYGRRLDRDRHEAQNIELSMIGSPAAPGVYM